MLPIGENHSLLLLNLENMKKFFLFLVVLGILAGLLFGYFKCIEKQEETIRKLESKIEFLKETQTPIRFKILEKTANSIKLSAKFYNADDKEIGKLDTILSGQELSFDFYVVQVKDRYIAFPYKIYSNQIAAANGIELYNLYDKEGFPEVFTTKGMDKDLNSGLKYVFSKVKTGKLDSSDKYFGNMVHDIRELKSFIPHNVYSIVTHTKGGIEIIEE
jgi:hypothetical protein